MKKVITYGTFDLFHQGHYNLLKNAKALGDYLIVGVTTEHFDESRGKTNVIDPILERIENVRKTGFADEIIIEDHNGQKIEDIQRYKVDIFTVGSDWVGTFDYLNKFCKVIYLPRTPDVSSTALRQSRFKIVNLGITGSGRIVPRFIKEARFVSGIEVVADYDPVTKTANQFEKKHQVPCYQGEYEDFLNEVNAVYVASPSETHYDYTKKALQKDKHVICEKPVAFTRKQAQELYDLAKSRGLILMEGVKTAYCPGFLEIVNTVRSGIIGEVRDVEACFTRLADPKARECTDTRFGGGFMEYGGYPLLPIIKLLGRDYKEISFHSFFNKKGVDQYSKLQIYYEDAMATAKTGVGVKSEGNLIIAGTKGYILAPSPWWLTKRFEVRFEDPDKVEIHEPQFVGEDGLRYEISEFVMMINGYNRDFFKLTPEESIAMADITERYLRYAGKL